MVKHRGYTYRGAATHTRTPVLQGEATAAIWQASGVIQPCSHTNTRTSILLLHP